ncbi:MAG: AarF/ABC1/UbiB kinase family protein [Proteobacteria bacterium]|nr:AarF/ABC1/UbiB kinase family protein [Pseudomonadota bacterium]
MSTKVSASYVGRRAAGAFQNSELRERAMKRLHESNAERIVETMGLLKGAAMKVGQTVALAAEHLDLPPDVTRVLGKLHADVEPLPFETIKYEVERSLEGSLEERFARFDPDPIGTASLGQAHSAMLPDGQEVVVKVLHSGIERSVASDLKALRSILTSTRIIRRSKAEVDAIFAEIEERLNEELDYLQEAANIAEYQRIFGDDARVRIPNVHPGWSTERVLTMDHLPGVHVDAFVESASAEARQRAGRTLAELHYQQAFELRTLHADPHPGNYLFEPDGRVGLLDFGCVKRFDEFWIGAYARTALAAHAGDRAGTIQGARDAGVLHGHSEAADEMLWQWCAAVIRPYRMGHVEAGSERDDDWMTPIMKLTPQLAKFPEIQAPGDILYLHRALGGNYNMLRRLGAAGDWGELMTKYAEHAVAVAEGRA